MSEWRSMDNAPKDGTNVLLYGRRIRRIAYYDDQNNSWRMLPGHSIFHEPSAWQPLPEPPDEAPAA